MPVEVRGDRDRASRRVVLSRRTLYIVAGLFFVPLVVWYATAFSDVPVVSITEARQIADSSSEGTKKVLIAGLIEPIEVPESAGTIEFWLKESDDGERVRVVLEGQESEETAEFIRLLEADESIQVAGHICSDKKGERFHAKSFYKE